MVTVQITFFMTSFWRLFDVFLTSFYRKDRMVLKVHEFQKPAMLKELDREKKNMMYCMKPAVSIVSTVIISIPTSLVLK